MAEDLERLDSHTLDVQFDAAVAIVQNMPKTGLVSL